MPAKTTAKTVRTRASATPAVRKSTKTVTPKKAAISKTTSKTAASAKRKTAIASKRASGATPKDVTAAQQITPAAAPGASLPKLPADAPAILGLCLRALDEKKAEDLVVVDVREKSSITDFFVVATATSEPHLRALRVALEKEFAAAGETIHRSETGSGTGWNVVDAFDVIVHLFLPAQRAACQIEKLWENTARRPARTQK